MAVFAWPMSRARKPWPLPEFGAALRLSSRFDRHQRPRRWVRHTAWRNQTEVAMPIDSMLVSAAVVTMFVVFAAVLAWGERQSRPLHQPADSHRKRRSF